MLHLFISYSHADRALVQGLDKGLQENRLKVWWDKELKESSTFRNEIAEAILKSRALLVLVTPNSVCSPEVLMEVQFAYDRKIRIIPIVLGEVDPQPGQAGLLLLLSNSQKILSLALEVDKQLIQRCCDAIRDEREPPAAVMEAFTPFQLAPLEISQDEIPPPPSGDQPHIVMACYQYMADNILRKDWDKATGILDDIEKHHVYPRRVRDHKRIREWYLWVKWYEATSAQYQSWSETARKLGERLEDAESSRKALADSCALVCMKLKREWLRLLEESCQRVLNCLVFSPIDGSYSYAVKHLELLQPEFLFPVIRALGIPAGCTASQLDQPLEWAKGALAAYNRSASEAFSLCRKMLGRQFPPTRKEISALEGIWKDCQKQRESALRFVDFLTKNALQDEEESAISELIERLQQVVLKESSHHQLPPFAACKRAAHLWESTLQAISGGEAAGKKATAAQKSILKASDCFPKAKKHHALVRSWLESRRHYGSRLCPLLRKGALPQAKEAVADLEASCRMLAERLVDPYARQLRISSQRGEGLDWVTDWQARLEEQTEQLRTEGVLLRAVDQLKDCQPDEALRTLGSLKGQRDQANAWESIAGIMLSLVDESRKGGFPLNRSGMDKTFEDPSILEADVEFERWLEQIHLAEKHVKCAKIGSCECDSKLLPQLAQWRAQVEVILKARQLWSQVKALLRTLEMEKAVRKGEQLRDCFAPAKSAFQVIEIIARAEKDCQGWRDEHNAHRWSEAADGLDRLTSHYQRVLEESTSSELQLGEIIQNRIQELKKEAAHCSSAAQDEECLELSLASLSEATQSQEELSERLDKAFAAFESMKTSIPSIQIWHRAVIALHRLIQELSKP